MKSRKRSIFVIDSHLKDSVFTAVMEAKFYIRYVKGVPFVNRKYTKGVPFRWGFREKWYKRARGSTSGRSLPCLRADVSYFLCCTRKRVPFPRATKEIGDVCTQARASPYKHLLSTLRGVCLFEVCGVFVFQLDTLGQMHVFFPWLQHESFFFAMFIYTSPANYYSSSCCFTSGCPF